uniref:Uncharacterized protein n=1 Tax=Arundo donax TaxID=35708 RepID=A0A0A9H0Z0_ARUDO
MLRQQLGWFICKIWCCGLGGVLTRRVSCSA